MKNYLLLDDQTLVRLYESGDPAAFGVLVERHTKSLSGAIFNLVKDPMLTEDLLQDTFIKAMDAIQRKSYSNENFKAWTSRIAHNLCMDYFRRSKRMKITSLSQENNNSEEYYLDDQKELSPEDEIVKLEVDFDINELINALPPEQKEVLVLRHFHEMSFQDIADYIGNVSINTCLGRMRYGLINLKKAVRDIKTVGRKILQ